MKDGRRAGDRAVTPALLLTWGAVLVVCVVGLVVLSGSPLLRPFGPRVEGWPWVAVVLALLLWLSDRARVPVGHGTSAQVTVSLAAALLVAGALLVEPWVFPLLVLAQLVSSPWHRQIVNAAFFTACALLSLLAAGGVSLLLADVSEPARLTASGLVAALVWWVVADATMALFMWQLAGIPPSRSPVLEPYANRVMLTELTTGMCAAVMVRTSWWFLPLAALLLFWLHRQLSDQGNARPAVVDPMTGLLRYEIFRTAVYREQVDAERSGRPLALLMIDLDSFRDVNDAVGYAGADMVLAGVGRRLSSELRKEDITARYGGDEFLVLLGSSRVDDAATIARRLRERICAEPFRTARGDVSVCASIGVTELGPNERLDDALARVDVALYEAKGGDGLAVRRGSARF